MTDTYNPKLVHLPGTELTPEVVLHRTLNKKERIRAVIVVIQWDDESFDTDWSMMKVSELCMGARALDHEIDSTIWGGENLK